MPRIARRLLRRARAIDPLLPPLLQPCRDLSSARNELRWLREHVDEQTQPSHQHRPAQVNLLTRLLTNLVRRRARGEPLQYLLGTQPFGDLEILCRKGVLIPRPDTESYATYLARRLIIRQRDAHSSYHPALTGQHHPPQPRLRVLDLCTGTGCIALLLHSLLRRHVASLHVRGVDISPRALRLANSNLRHNVESSALTRDAIDEVSFVRRDVLADDALDGEVWDVIVSNPPYISHTSFYSQTEASVRHFEPRLALAPDVQMQEKGEGVVDVSGDVFYERLMRIGEKVGAKVLVMEVEDQKQAERVLSGGFEGSEGGGGKYWRPYGLWCDDISWDSRVMGHVVLEKTGMKVPICGTSRVRAVVLVSVDETQCIL